MSMCVYLYAFKEISENLRLADLLNNSFSLRSHIKVNLVWTSIFAMVDENYAIF